MILKLCEAIINDPAPKVCLCAIESLPEIISYNELELDQEICWFVFDTLSQVVNHTQEQDPNVREAAIITITKFFTNDSKTKGTCMTETPKYDLRGAKQINIIEESVGNLNINQYDTPQASNAQEIQNLIEQVPGFDKQNQKSALQALEQEIKHNPTLKARLLSAVRSGGIETLKHILEAIFRSPLVAIPLETIKGWIEAE
jgi:hypothetical protein